MVWIAKRRVAQFERAPIQIQIEVIGDKHFLCWSRRRDDVFKIDRVAQFAAGSDNVLLSKPGWTGLFIGIAGKNYLRVIPASSRPRWRSGRIYKGGSER